MAVYTLDTSALLAYIRGEAGADLIEGLLRDADQDPSQRLLIPFIAMMEVEYILRRNYEDEIVERDLAMITSWPAEIMESQVTWRRLAAAVKGPGSISLADSWVAALALLDDAELVHKDPEFDAVQGLKALRLPYDRDTTGSGV